MAKFSQRSKDALKGVHPDMVRLMEAAVVDTPVDFTIVEGVRALKTQQMYYSWGRTVLNPNTGPVKGNKLGAKVTNADGIKSKSNHQVKADGYSHAVDLYPYVKGGLDINDKGGNLKVIAAHIKATAKRLGISVTWGGDWESPFDPPHFELKR